MGKYVNSNLVKDESVKFETTYHWIIFCSLRALFTLFLAPLIERYADEFAITNKRVIIKTGWLSRKTVEMSLARIESVKVEQSIMGRILGYGTVKMIGTGGTRGTLRNISNPLVFRKIFQELSD